MKINAVFPTKKHLVLYIIYRLYNNKNTDIGKHAIRKLMIWFLLSPLLDLMYVDTSKYMRNSWPDFELLLNVITKGSVL